jgi:hypothetical protein
MARTKVTRRRQPAGPFENVQHRSEPSEDSRIFNEELANPQITVIGYLGPYPYSKPYKLFVQDNFREFHGGTHEYVQPCLIVEFVINELGELVEQTATRDRQIHDEEGSFNLPVRPKGDDWYLYSEHFDHRSLWHRPLRKAGGE